MQVVKLILLLCLLTVFGTGCGEVEVISSVDAKQSIELLVLFDHAGVHAVRDQLSSGSKERYRIVVGRYDYSRALHVMHELQLPRERDDDIERLTKQQGFFPQTQALAAARYDVVQALKVERQIEALPGVLDARVAIHSPAVQGGVLDSSMRHEPQASVVIRHVPSKVELPFSTNTVREIVALAVPGLSPEQVAIEVVPLSLNSFRPARELGSPVVLWPFQFQVPADQFRIAQRQVLAFALVAVGLGLLFGGMIAFSIVRHRFRARVALGVEMGEVAEPQVSEGRRSLRKQTLAFDPKELRTIDSADTLPK